MTTPSPRAFVPFVSVDQMMKLINNVGLAPMMQGICDRIEADFRRWPLFDKNAPRCLPFRSWCYRIDADLGW